MGGVIAFPLVAAFLEPHFGWRKTFLIIGSLGIVWLVAWLAVYRPLSRHPRLTPEEHLQITSGQPHSDSGGAAPITPRKLLALRQTWGILLARFLVDPVWWLYMLWLPTYLKEVRHFSLKDVGASGWLPYLAAAPVPSLEDGPPGD